MIGMTRRRRPNASIAVDAQRRAYQTKVSTTPSCWSGRTRFQSLMDEGALGEHTLYAPLSMLGYGGQGRAAGV